MSGRPDDAPKTPPAPERDDDARKRTEKRPADPERDKQDELDEGLDETFPASDPPAPSRPTGAR